MLSEFIQLIKQSFVEPRTAARKVLNFNLTIREVGEVVVLAIVVSTLLTQVPSLFITSTDMVDPDVPSTGMQELSITPFSALTINATLMAITILAVYLIGNLFGGRGTIRGSMIVNAWIHYMMIIVQVVLFLVTTIVPVLAIVVIPLALFVFFWLLSHFVAVLHGFRSAMGVFFAALVLILVASFAITSLFFALNA